jgi:hypothetical protein
MVAQLATVWLASEARHGNWYKAHATYDTQLIQETDNRMDGQRQLPVAAKAGFSSRIMLSNSPATGHVDRSYRRHVTSSAVTVAVAVAVGVHSAPPTASQWSAFRASSKARRTR